MATEIKIGGRVIRRPDPPPVGIIEEIYLKLPFNRGFEQVQAVPDPLPAGSDVAFVVAWPAPITRRNRTGRRKRWIWNALEKVQLVEGGDGDGH